MITLSHYYECNLTKEKEIEIYLLHEIHQDGWIIFQKQINGDAHLLEP